MGTVLTRSAPWTASTSRTTSELKTLRAQAYHVFRQPPAASFARAKARQRIKMGEVEAALRRVGLVALDEQAKALGISRTTTWRLFRSDYNGSEPSAVIINRILCAPRLPLPARIKILEYIQERVSGVYGHSESQSRRFSIRIGWRSKSH